MRVFFSFFTFLIGLLCYAQQDNYTITNLKINNENPHFGLMPISSNQLLFTSYLLDKRGKIKQELGNPLLNIYQAQLTDTGEIGNYEEIPIDTKQNISHITSATISSDGKQLYITTFYNNKNRPKGDFKETNFHIEVGEFKEGVGWTNFKVLPFCNPRYSYGHPALSKDGKTLFFISNMRGGKETTKGGSDIFKVAVLGDNTFGEPENLGSMVNSYSREMFPFISADNILYFASNRPNGFGAFDIYKSKLNDDGTFEKAEKLPEPINSSKDDLSFVIDVNNKSGYFTSKRTEGGKGDDDIYYFTLN